MVQITRVLSRHGILGALRGRGHWPPPSEVRLAFEDLGVVFLKFGQVLAMRRDLLPQPYIRELEQLHDHLKPLPFGTIRATVERQLGKPLGRLFRSFDPQPLASATIAQVHEARTMDGRHVVVKVRRPGLDAAIEQDIATLKYLAQGLESLFPRLVDVGLQSMVREFESTLRREVDFRREARSIRRFRAHWAGSKGVWIPAVMDGLSSEAVLTMTHSPGLPIDRWAKKHPGKVEKPVALLFQLMLKGVFEDGLFHADPHPGNVLVLPDGRICLIDLGMVGELDQGTRESLRWLLEGVLRGDPAAVAHSYLEIAETSEYAERAAFKSEVRVALQDMRGLDLEQVSFGNTLAALLKAGTRNGVRSSPSFFLLTRVFIILESELHRFAPGFDYLAALRGEVDRLRRKHLSVARIARQTGRAALELERFLRDAPSDARRALRQLADGSLGNVHAPQLEGLAARINSDIQHLTVAVAAAGLIVGGATLSSYFELGWRALFGELSFFAGLLTIAVIGLRSLRRFLARRFASWGPRPDKTAPPQ